MVLNFFFLKSWFWKPQTTTKAWKITQHAKNERANALFLMKIFVPLIFLDIWIEISTRWVSWYQVYQARLWECLLNCEACRAIQHAFPKPSLVNLISKDRNMVFYPSVYKLSHSSNYSDYDNFFFRVDSTSLRMSFKKCNVIITWKRHKPWDRQRLSATCNNVVNMSNKW